MTGPILRAIADTARSAAIDAGRMLAVFVVAGLIILGGLAFLLAAGFMALAAKFGAIAAAIGLGVALLALGLIVLAVMLPPSGDAHPRAANPAAHPPGTGRPDDQAAIATLIDAAMAGYATGQGDGRAMRAGLDRLLGDLVAMGVIDPVALLGQTATMRGGGGDAGVGAGYDGDGRT